MRKDSAKQLKKLPTVQSVRKLEFSNIVVPEIVNVEIVISDIDEEFQRILPGFRSKKNSPR